MDVFNVCMYAHTYIYIYAFIYLHNNTSNVTVKIGPMDLF